MHNVSPSQITTADRCLRRWWWQSVKGFKSPATDATLFGSAVHSAIEFRIANNAWGGDNDEVLRRAMPAYDALVKEVAPPGGGDLVEQDWSITDNYPLPARGRIDLVLPSSNTIVDWKTTASLRYVKTSSELDVDPQVIMYTDAMVAAGKVNLPANFLHVYTVTKGKPATLVVRTVVTADKLAIGRFKLSTTLRKMASVLALPDPTPEQVPANVLACQDFGGCPHYERCFSAGKQEQEQPTTEANVNLTEKLAARKVQQNAKPEPVVETKVETPARTQGKQYAGETLLIGALPYGSREEWQHAEDWLRQFADQACETLKIAHWAYAEYGKGKTAIIALVDAAAKAGDLPKNLVLDRRNTLSDAVAEVLLPHYRNVFVKMG